MLSITDYAKEKFKEVLENSAEKDKQVIRIKIAPKNDNRFEISLDEEKKGDEILLRHNNSSILVTNNKVADLLDGRIVDYQVSPQGEGFTISNPMNDN